MSTTTSDFLRHLRILAARQASSGLSDQQLLERFRLERSEASFAVLVQRHGPMVLNVCRRVLHHVQDSEDAFQATFLVLAKKAAALRQPPLLSGWLYGVAYHVAMRQKAKAQRRAAHERRVDPLPPADAINDITWRELRSVLDEELLRLPEQYRAPLVLCYLEARTQDEAARHLGWSKNTFTRRMNQARQMLARRLTRRGLSLPAALTAPLLIDSAAQAALSPLLAANTVRAGLAAAMGETAGGMVSAQVLALAEVSVGSLLAKKTCIAFLLLAPLVLGAGGLLAHRAVQDRTRADAPAASPPARNAGKAQAIEVRGRVLDPDGKPVKGAKVYVSTYTSKDKSDPKVRAESDGDGRFRFTANPAEVDRQEMVTGVAAGYGPDWVSLKEARNDTELTLRLVKDDVPIKGRVLDLEGRPIAGAAVRLLRVLKMPGEDPAPWLKEMQAKPTFVDERYFYDELMASVWGLLDAPKLVKTDAKGQFQLGGLGRDRLVLLRIEGAGIEYRRLSVMTRPGLASRRYFYDEPTDVHGAVFDHLATPSKPIRGTVRDKKSGKPLAGVQVACNLHTGQYAITDKDGHYEIPGVGKSKGYHLTVSGPAVIRQGKRVGDTPGLEPITVDFDVECGLAVRVRAREKGAGKPVQGIVDYRFRTDNRNLDRYLTYPREEFNYSHTDKDGVCNMVVLPGPGYIAFWAKDEHFARSRLKEHKGGNHYLEGVSLQHLILDNYNAVVPIDPSAKDPNSLLIDIELERGRSVGGSVADAEGRPLSGAWVYGLRAVGPYRGKRDSDYVLATPSFTATGLAPGRPRTLVFYHAAKKLGKIAVVRGDDKGPLAVRLEPLCAVTGRVVDAQGRARVGTKVRLAFDREQSEALPQDAIILGQSMGYKNPLLGEAISDKDGCFRMDKLIAGAKYRVIIGVVDPGEKFVLRPVVKVVSGKPEETVDLGEVTTKELSEKEQSP